MKSSSSSQELAQGLLSWWEWWDLAFLLTSHSTYSLQMSYLSTLRKGVPTFCPAILNQLVLYTGVAPGAGAKSWLWGEAP